MVDFHNCHMEVVSVSLSERRVRMRYFRIKPLVRYRFKDRMDCVFFRTFRTDREARLWFENNKVAYQLKEFGSMGLTYKT